MTELESLFRAEWGRILSALIRSFGDFDLAEDALQDAFSSAVLAWEAGTPQNPRAWLYATARHKAIDRIRRRTRFAEKETELAALTAPEKSGEPGMTEECAVPDERLRLIFTCCHPALAAEAQVALTLRTVCGLTTEEIAGAFMLPTATMAQRLVRAKAKIRGAAIPYRIRGISPRLCVGPKRSGEALSGSPSRRTGLALPSFPVVGRPSRLPGTAPCLGNRDGRPTIRTSSKRLP